MGINGKGLLDYLSSDFVSKFIKLIKFLVIYSVGFFIISTIFKYAVPFIIAIFIALALKPLKKRILRINNKCKYIRVSNGFISLILTLTIVVVVLGLLSVVGYQLFIQTQKYLLYITNESTINAIISTIDKLINETLVGMNNLNPSIVTQINESIMNIVNIASNMITTLGKNILNIAISIPAGILITLLTLIATFFFTKDIELIEDGLSSMLSKKGHNLFHTVFVKVFAVLGGYVKAYSLILLWVATSSFIIFQIVKIDYALPIAILTAFLDLLPLIGTGAVFIVLIISHFITGNSTAAIILIIGYAIVGIGRQLIEQNVVASFIGVHPLIMIMALFVAFTPLGFAGMFYFLGAYILFQAVK